MKVYYNFEQDILCIVEGKRIFKYIGEFSTGYTRTLALYEHGMETWYEANVHPKRFREFRLIGTI